MEFQASIDQIHTILGWIRKELESLKLTPKVLYQIELASEEALINIIEHSYAGKGGVVFIDILAGKEIEITFKDEGNPFDYESLPAPDISSELEERKIGGLGIHLIKNLMDRVHYGREKGMNVFKIVKRF